MVRQHTYIFLKLAKRSLASLVFSIFLTAVNAQSLPPAFDQLADKLQPVIQNRPVEIVYLQTSKGTYETLEDLWFKAYVLDAQLLSPSPRGKTLYVQLVSEQNGKTYKQERYEIKDGIAACHLFLPDSLPEGNYLLRAFTPWSVDGGSSELKTIRRIKLIKQLKTDKTEIKPTTPAKYNGRILLGLFPEGGDLVTGILQRVAFKGVDTLGMPVETKGTLLEDTTAVLRFESRHAGMGAFEFTPGEGKKYSVKLDGPDSSVLYPLPTPKEDGVCLRLISLSGDTARFLVSQKRGSPKTTVYLRGQSRGTVYCMAKVTLKEEVTVRMPLLDFPVQGIAEFTLFNDSLEPVAERLIYVHPDKGLRIEARSDKQLYMTREKVTVKIKVSGENGLPIRANLGVSIYDKLYQTPNDPVNILSYSYLSSQLKGRLYDPAYYFDEKNKDRKEALDLLLLTQGWRRYVWGEGALGDCKDSVAHLCDGIEGIIHIPKQNKIVENIPIFIAIQNAGDKGNNELLMIGPDKSFVIDTRHLKTHLGGYIYLKPIGPEACKPEIILFDPFEIVNNILKHKTVAYPVASDIVKKQEGLTDLDFKKFTGIKLKEVTVKAQGISLFRNKYIGQLDSIAKADFCADYVGVCGMLNCAACIGGTKPIEGKKYRIWVGQRSQPKSHPYAYTNDEMKTIVYHYPKYTEEELLKLNNLTRVKAYYPNREFYNPNYDKDTVALLEPDFRNTLLWAPSVETDEKGEATLEFYTSDINSRFTGAIEGVGLEGLPGRQEFEFVVRKRPGK